MENEFTFKEVWMMIFGHGYLVNHHTREVHRISEKHHNCQLNTIAKKNRDYCTKKYAKHLIRDCGYNGCRWCWNPMDNG